MDHFLRRGAAEASKTKPGTGGVMINTSTHQDKEMKDVSSVATQRSKFTPWVEK